LTVYSGTTADRNRFRARPPPRDAIELASSRLGQCSRMSLDDGFGDVAKVQGAGCAGMREDGIFVERDEFATE
jgi:hypothetical protein